MIVNTEMVNGFEVSTVTFTDHVCKACKNSYAAIEICCGFATESLEDSVVYVDYYPGVNV